LPFANSDKIFHPNAEFWEIDIKKYGLKEAIKNITQKILGNRRQKICVQRSFERKIENTTLMMRKVATEQ
jgi:hypothetical protein